MNITVAMISVLLLAAIGMILWIKALLREEERRNRMFIDSMSNRPCLACHPWGGWILGQMRSDGSYEVRDCEICGGTGKLPIHPRR